MNDFTKDIQSLKECGAHYFSRRNHDQTINVICYEPYVIYNKETSSYEPSCYVYHWCDTYTPEGQFISHEAYECVYTTELDYDI